MIESFLNQIMQTVKRIVKYLTPVPLKKALKYGYYSVLDIKDTVTGKSNPNIPPRRLNFVGSEDFLNVANEFFGYFTDPNLGGVEPNHKILDIGSGIGRMAIPFIDYMSDEGAYHGFDIDKRGVHWCQENLSKRHPNFHFEYVDLFNKYYNKKGKLSSSTFDFPYEDNFFNFIFATSVFTHMLTPDVLHYFEEISRVMNAGGRAMATFFVIDELAQKAIEEKRTTCDLKYEYDSNSFYSHKNVPEAEIGFLSSWIEEAAEQSGLTIEKTLYGSWSGRLNPFSYQDILILRKK